MEPLEATEPKGIAKHYFLKGFKNQRQRPLRPRSEKCESAYENGHCKKCRVFEESARSAIGAPPNEGPVTIAKNRSPRSGESAVSGFRV